MLVGLGTGEAWTVVGALRAGLVLCACEVGQVLLFGAYGSGAGVLSWSWLGLGLDGVSGGWGAVQGLRGGDGAPGSWPCLWAFDGWGGIQDPVSGAAITARPTMQCG